MEQLKDRFAQTPDVVAVRGKGLMIGIELAKSCGALASIAAENGLLVTVTADRVVRILPAYILSDEEADELINRLANLVITFLAENSTSAESA